MNKKNKYFDSILTQESITFKLEILSRMSSIKYNTFSNLNFDELKILKTFTRDRPFKVVELDKNIGAGIISNQLYDNLVLEILDDNCVYTKFECDPLNECAESLSSLLISQHDANNISDKLFYLLFAPILNKSYKFGSFRALPKLHKKAFSIRPIINYKYHLTSLLCILIDFIIRPFVIKCESYIKDSQDLIQKTQKLKLHPTHFLYSCDFESLYTNIIHSDCIFMLCDFLKDKLVNEHINISAFKEFLKFILDNNYFTFNNSVYKQNIGIAMGSACGPSIANLFVYIYEKKWLHIHKPIVYYRFIDDIFIISQMNPMQLSSSLNKSFGQLKLNIISNTIVNFLDLNITFDPLTSSLDFYLYTKPTNTFSYLYILSNHPPFIFKNIIKSLFIRIRRICTKLNNFILFSSILSKQLIKRGYNIDMINKIFTMVAKLQRNSLLEYKQRKQINFNDTFIFKYFFDFNVQNINEIIYSSFFDLRASFPFLRNTNIKIVNKMQNNISSLLVHNFKLKKYPIKYCFKRCANANCSICIFSNTSSFITLNNNLNIPIQSFSSCNSKNAIYIIHFKLCSAFYIGQTVEIKQRIYTHIYSIKNFSPYLNNNTCVSTHFNLKPHNWQLHFSFFVLYTDDVDNLQKRLNNEAFIINLFIKCKCKVLNDYIPPIRSYLISNN